MKATLILADGSVWNGESIGGAEEKVCELVFNTSMTGFQELLTDPSYAGQGVVLSYPLVGNYGVNSQDNESGRAWPEVLVVRHLSDRGSNFRREEDLNDFLKKQGVTGIAGLDTRALTKKLRNQGTMNALVTCETNFDLDEKLSKLRAYEVGSRIERVTCAEAKTVGEGGRKVALLDYGTKRSLIDTIAAFGCAVTVFPADTAAETILSGGFDGAVLSEGPGDPALCTAQVEEIRKLLAAGLPLFGIGLGHQLLALANGFATEKLPYGHRGANHPVRCVKTGRVHITAQNHGYAVARDSVDAAVAEVSHENVNDSTVEGLRYVSGKALSVQFDPTHKYTAYLFDAFFAMMGGTENA